MIAHCAMKQFGTFVTMRLVKRNEVRLIFCLLVEQLALLAAYSNLVIDNRSRCSSSCIRVLCEKRRESYHIISID